MGSKTDGGVCSSNRAAELLNVTPRTIQLWADSGIVRSWKTPGGHRRYSVKELNDLALQIKNGVVPDVSDDVEQKTLNVLIIEDDPVLNSLYKATLQSWKLPIKIVFAMEGYSGLLQAGLNCPDLVILDINLPDINGYKIVDSMFENKLITEEQLIIVSGLPLSEIRKNLPEKFSSPIYGKPVPMDEIKRKVISLLSK
ncbi:response regulator [Neptuniibacter sp. SY11_33]|uniref:response regulator n=1 Tax=Neptuniibacter sp. SY11_33 TaxID=3398215 RepID=UPI0039F4E461